MPKIAFMFPGQASQYRNMGKDVYQKYDIAKQLFELASDIYGEDLCEIAFRKPFKEIMKTHNAQILITLLNVIYLELSCQRGLKPDLVMGFSVGEVTALYAAGILSLEDLFRYITIRGHSMHHDAKTSDGSMYVIGQMDSKVIEKIIQSHKDNKMIGISGYNSIDQTVISGQTSAVKWAADQIRNEKGIVKDLKQEGAWHSYLMSNARSECQKALETIELSPPKIPIIFNLTAEFENRPQRIKSNMIQQITSPVKWKQSLFQAKDSGIDTFFEIGPGKVLSGLAMKTFNSVDSDYYTIHSINSPVAVENLDSFNGKINNLSKAA